MFKLGRRARRNFVTHIETRVHGWFYCEPHLRKRFPKPVTFLNPSGKYWGASISKLALPCCSSKTKITSWVQHRRLATSIGWDGKGFVSIFSNNWLSWTWMLVKDIAYYCYCSYVLRISTNWGFLLVVLTNTVYRGIFSPFKTMRRKENLASALGIQKENWG